MLYQNVANSIQINQKWILCLSVLFLSTRILGIPLNKLIIWSCSPRGRRVRVESRVYMQWEKSFMWQVGFGRCWQRGLWEGCVVCYRILLYNISHLQLNTTIHMHCWWEIKDKALCLALCPNLTQGDTLENQIHGLRNKAKESKRKVQKLWEGLWTVPTPE